MGHGRPGFDPVDAGRSGGLDHGPGPVRDRALLTLGDILPGGHVLLPTLLAGFILVRLAEAVGAAPGWVRSFGDDLLCLPLVLSLVLVVHRLVRRCPDYNLPFFHGLLALILFTVYFEVVLPGTGHPAVGDPLDFLFYLVGFIVFQLGLNRQVADTGNRADIPRKKIRV